MFIKEKIKPGDKVTVTLVTGRTGKEPVATVLGYDEHHIGLNTTVESYIPWSAVAAVTIYERAAEEIYSVEDTVR